MTQSNNVSVAHFGANYTPQQLMLSFSREEQEDAERMLIVWQDKDGAIRAKWACDSSILLLGMIDVSKHQILTMSFQNEP
jgi:streptomycin 6-kinase